MVLWYFQQYFSYIVAISFIGGGNRSIRAKTIDLLQVTDKLYNIMLYIVLATLSMTGTVCIGSCKSNYNTITSTTAPLF
jgi:hypothetical protein